MAFGEGGLAIGGWHGVGEVEKLRGTLRAMKTRGFWALDEVSDDALEGNLRALLSGSGRTDAQVVAHLAEVDARRLHLLGGRSLFEYCLVRLGLSESEAYYRICAARAARQYPLVFELLERREIHLTTIALIGKRLCDENHRELLAEVGGKTKRQVLEIIARRWPKSAVASEVRRLPVRASAVAAGPTGTLEPLDGESCRLQLHVSSALNAKLELARDLMSHANPSGDLAVVVERALDFLIEKLHQRRFGQTKRAGAGGGNGRKSAEPRAPADQSAAPVLSTTSSTETATTARKRTHIPNEVRRQVLERDGLGCAYVAPDGHRCGARAFLQIDHQQAWAKGGEDDIANLRVLCAAHNRLCAEKAFGADVVRRAVELRSAKRQGR